MTLIYDLNEKILISSWSNHKTEEKHLFKLWHSKINLNQQKRILLNLVCNLIFNDSFFMKRPPPFYDAYLTLYPRSYWQFQHEININTFFGEEGGKVPSKIICNKIKEILHQALILCLTEKENVEIQTKICSERFHFIILRMPSFD